MPDAVGLLVAGILAVLGIVGLVLVLSRLKALERQDERPGLGLLQEQINALRGDVSRSIESQVGLLDRRIAETTRTVGDRLDSSGTSRRQRGPYRADSLGPADRRQNGAGPRTRKRSHRGNRVRISRGPWMGPWPGGGGRSGCARAAVDPPSLRHATAVVPRCDGSASLR